MVMLVMSLGFDVDQTFEIFSAKFSENMTSEIAFYDGGISLLIKQRSIRF
jgi:hypothetical protein